MPRFSITYFLLAAALLITEVLIGLYVRDSIIRPYGGDFLVVILMYCFVKSFARLTVKTAALAVLLLAYAVEVSQYFKLTVQLGLKNSTLANMLLGNSFSWTDMLAYTLGIMVVIAIEKSAIKKSTERRMASSN